MADRQQFIIEGIAKVDNVLNGIKKIQNSLGNLRVPDTTQRQIDALTKRMEQQGEKAKKAISSGFESKASVKNYTDALDSIARIYDEIIDKAKELKLDTNLSLKLDTSDLEKSNKALEQFEADLKVAKKEADAAKTAAQKVFTGVATAYGKNKNPFQEWGEAARKFKNGDIQGVKQELDKLEQKFQGKDQTNRYWAPKVASYEKLKAALESYQAAQDKALIAQQNKDAQEQVSAKYVEAARKELEKSLQTMEKVATEAQNMADAEGKAAKDTQQLNSELEHFKNKAAYFFGLSNAINLFKRAVRSAYNTVKDLDAVMTETAVVTNFDVGDMWAQLPEYTERANELGVSIHSAYEAATIFYQQGLKTNEVMAVSNETLKMARIAGLDAATASDRMTNALRGFNMEMDKMSAQRVNDVYSKLAAITASDTDEISTAMTKVASLAHNANMEFETTAAFLAQIIESTRESAETAGTALKTVVARFSEVKELYSKGELLGQDEEGEEIDVNRVSTALRSAGINLNEYLTGAKGLDDIFIELAEKWDSLDIVQQRYIATMAAGSRQQSRFIALMSDYKRTMQLVEAANNAEGASQEQYSKTLESLQTKLARLKNAWDEFILGLTNSDVIKGAVDLLTLLITKINDLIKLVSGKNAGVKMITTFFTAFTAFKVGSKVVGKNGGLTKFFASFIGADATQLANMKAGQLAKSFYSSLATQMANPGNKVVNNNSTANILKDYFLPVTNKTFISNTESLQGPLYDALDTSKMTSAQFKELWTTVEKGNLTVGELNAALKKANQDIQITGKNAQQFGLGVDKATTSMRLASLAAAALGVALLNVGSNLEKQEGPMKDWGTLIKGLGTGLMMFGTIMSVYLPLQAQLMAQGVTSAIVSIPIVGWIVGIISLLVALGTAIYNFSKNNSAEAKLEQASEAAKYAAEAAEEAKNAYEKLGEALDNIADKYKAIEDLAEGTREWRDAVREVNDAVIDLSENYPSASVSRRDNGTLYIENQDQFEEEERRKSIIAQAAAKSSKINQLNRAQDIEWQKAGKSFSFTTIDDLTNEGTIADYANATRDEIKEALVKSFAARNAYLDENYVDYYIDEIQDYAKGYRTTQDRVSAQRMGIGSDIISYAGIDKDYQKYANAFVNDDLIEQTIKRYEEEIDTVAKDQGKDVKQQYAEARGYTNYEQFESENAEEAEKLTDAQMRSYIATTNAVEQTSKQLIAFTNNLANLDDVEKAYFASQEGGGLTLRQAQGLQGRRDEDVLELYQKLGGDAVYGPDGFAAFLEQFRKDVEIALGRFDLDAGGYTSTFVKSFREGFTDEFGRSLTEDLSSGTFKELADNLWSVYTNSGWESMKEVQSSIKDLTKGVDPDKVDDLVKAISDIDWASVDSIRTLSDLAEEYGISEDAIKSLENQIIEFNNAVKQVNLEQLTSSLALAKKILSGEQGRKFTEEDYKTAVAGGVNPDNFSYDLSSGEYLYKGQNIQEIVDILTNGVSDSIESLEKRYTSANAVETVVSRQGKVNDTNDPEELRKFIGQYIAAAGDSSLIDKDFLSYASFDDMRKAYDRIVADYDNRSSIEQDLDTARQRDYQLNTAAQNTELIQSENDEYARQALIDQIAASGLPEELISAFIRAVENAPVNAEPGNYLSNNGQVAANTMNTLDQAKQYGIETEDLNEYVEALRQIDDLYGAQEDTLYALALANARYQDGFKKIIESYDEWVELRQEDGSIRPEDGNLDQLKAYGQLKKNLKEMLNLSEDISDEFMQMPEVAELLGRAVDGDTKAVAELRAELAKLKLGDKLTDEVEYFIDQLTQESIDLEFGASFDDSEFAQGLMDALIAAGATAEEINEAFSNIGFTPPITGYQEIPYEDLAQNVQKANVKVVDPVTGAITEVTTDNVTDFKDAGVIKIPIFGDSKFTPPSMPSTKPSSSSGGGGGGSSTKKPSYWENPYDELYNLQEKINEALRTREALERRYQKLLKEEKATLSDIRKAYYSQITNLRAEADLQKQFAAGRLRQIQNIGEQMYTDSEGDRSSFSSWGVTKYASYDANTGLIQIDWNGLEEIANDSDREEEGKAAEAYISKLEELVGSYEEVRDKLWDIEDEIENLREAAIESYLSFEDRVLEALVNSYQQQIDSYQAMSDSLEKASNEVLTSLREQVELSRQIRDNTDKEQQIADMENRLAYLQRDTSGSNALEIQKLQKDLEDARESYTDNLVDQAIEKMQNEADLAAEQRARQIETMQEQLEIMKDTGALWQQVYDLMDEAAAGNGALSPKTTLVELLKDTEAFESLSNIGQAKWWSEVAEEFHAAWVGRDEAEDKYKTDANNDGVIANSGTSAAISSVSATADSVSPASSASSSGPSHDEATEAGVAMNICGPNNGWGNGETRRNRLEEKGFDYSTVQSIVNDIVNSGWDDSYYRRKYGISDLSDYSYYAFKSGGLADFTGPAWLDGTKAKPELILNAQDSANFIALKDILASLLNVQGGGLNGTKNGDNYFDIDISANIGSDYDVDRLAERLKQNIYNDGQYRNVNTINFLR